MAQPSGTPIPQSEPLYKTLHGSQDQVKNEAGGYVSHLDDMKRALRFVIMGNESGTYYAKESYLQRKNVKCIDRLIGCGKGVELVQLIEDVSVNRRNVKQDQLLLAFAICARSNDKDTKKAAYALLSKICRIPTHLFMFIKFCEQENKDSGTGWGRAHKRAVCNWYKNFENRTKKLARLVTKYKRRESWSHRDVLRLAHLSSKKPCLIFILRYVLNGLNKAKEMYLNDKETNEKVLELSKCLGAFDTASKCEDEEKLCCLIKKHKLEWEQCSSKLLTSKKVWDRYVLNGLNKAKEMYLNDKETNEKVLELSEYLGACDTASKCEDEEKLCCLIKKHKLEWEQCNSKFLKSKKVWTTLLPHLGMWAMVRNLGRMTCYGMFAVNSEEEQICIDKLKTINRVIETCEHVEHMEVDDDTSGEVSSEDAEERLHPFKILLGWHTYKNGSGEKGKLTWSPNQNIVTALEQAFYKSFKDVQRTGKKFYLAVDVSGSMSQPVLGSSNIYCSVAAACMMMVTARTEQNCIIKGFSNTMKDLGIVATDTLETVKGKVDRMTFGSTDCAAPIIDAMDSKIRDIDVFIVYTDNETWYGKMHPSEALIKYRQWSDRRHAKLIVCGMCATEFSIVDPHDADMMDIAGFDAAAPRIISEFAMGKL